MITEILENIMIFLLWQHMINCLSFIIDSLNHSQKKRNSLDTRALFIEFFKYVENSGLVVY